MKDFLKHSLIFVFLLIVVTSLIGSGAESNRKSSSVGEIVQVIENNSGVKVLDDGMLSETSEIKESGNFFSRAIEKIGCFVVDIFAKLLELIAKVISKFLG